MTVRNVLVSELQSHLVHVQIHTMKKLQLGNVKFVPKFVLGVLILHTIVELVWLTESMPQLVNVHLDFIKI